MLEVVNLESIIWPYNTLHFRKCLRPRAYLKPVVKLCLWHQAAYLFCIMLSVKYLLGAICALDVLLTP